MRSEVTLKVLWIEDQEFKSIIDTAKVEYNIDLTRVGSWEEALPLLKDKKYKQWDAVILDCYCLLNKDGVEDDRFLKQVLHELAKLVGDKDVLPWYVLSAGQKGNFLDILDRDLNNDRLLWDGNWKDIYYSKTGRHDGKTDVKCLFENIVNWVTNNSKRVKLMAQFPEVFGIDSEVDGWLLEILPFLNPECSKNASVFNRIRMVMDWVMKYCNNAGILTLKFEGHNLDACMKKLRNSNMTTKFVPLTIQQSLSLAVELSQNGSHWLEVEKRVKAGHEPFLLRSVIFAMMEILVWCKTLPTDEYEQYELYKEVSRFSDDTDNSDIEQTYEDYEGILEKDEDGNLHCNQCLVHPNNEKKIGEKVVLKNITRNTIKTYKKRYPFFAKTVLSI